MLNLRRCMVSFIENLRNFAPVFTSIALSKKTVYEKRYHLAIQIRRDMDIRQ